MQHRRLMIFAAIVSLFGFGVIIWYFLFSTPASAPSLEEKRDPLPFSNLPARFGFIFQDDNPPEQTTETEVMTPRTEPFINVWDKPATGNTFVYRSFLKQVVSTSTSTTSPQVVKTLRATSTVLMFVDRETGHIYGHSMESGATYQMSNTTFPGIYDAYIFAGGTRILMRYLDTDRKTIKTILADIPGVEEGRDPQALQSVTSLQNNIRSVAVSESLSALSYLVPNSAGSSIYTISGKTMGKTAESPFSEWKLSYGGENLYATTLPSAYTEGMTVSLPSFSRLIGEKTGLMSVATRNGILLNSMWSSSGLLLFGSNGVTMAVLNVKTLADKCRATTDSYFICGIPESLPVATEGLPDDWYQGRISFKDSLMIVYPLRGEAFTLYSFEEKKGPMDVTHISTNPKADLISFIRKNDGTLWLLNTSLLADEQ